MRFARFQARLESGPGSSLVGAVQIERDIRRAAGRAGAYAAGQSEHCVLAEHRLADLEPVDADGTHDQRRNGPRQFGQRLTAGFLALRQAMQGKPTRAQPLDLEAAAQQGRRQGRNTKFVQLQPGTLGIGHAQLREPEIERDQTIQAGQADGSIFAAQGTAQQLDDQPFAGRGLSEGECGGKHEADHAHRPHQHEADSADHVSKGEVERPGAPAALSFSATA